MRRLLVLLILAAAPAVAAEPANVAATGIVPGGPPGTNVDMPFLMAPMLDADGKLGGYAYISSRLTAASAAAALDVRDKLPFIQDAFVRDMNGAAVTMADDRRMVDLALVESRLLSDARRVIGAAKVRLVTVCTVQIADLRPKTTPNLNTPGATDPKNPTKSRCEPESPAK